MRRAYIVPSTRLGWERVAVSAIFFVHGAVFASWAARVPAVQDEMRLPPEVLGLVLAGPGLGALAGSQLGGLLVHRFGSRAVNAAAPLALGIPLALIPTAQTAWALSLLLVLLGLGDGCTSVAMNAQAVVVQRRYQRTILNSLHAIRSIGALAGGLAGVATAALAWSLATQFLGTAVLLAFVSAAAACGLRPESALASQHTPASARDQDGDAAGGQRSAKVTVLLLTMMIFMAALVEDAPASWGGVYLRSLGADAATAAAAYTAFSAGQVITRLYNDWLVHRLGWPRLIRAGTLCCAAVLALALLLGGQYLTLGALFIAGAGVSAVFPGAFTAAGALPAPALAMGQIGFAGNLGWLLVSPIIGALAALVGLRAALGVLVLAALTIAALAPITRSPAPAGGSAERSALLGEDRATTGKEG